MTSIACPLCASTSAEIFQRRAHVPVHQNLVMADRAAALAAPRGALDMAACSTCGFVFNAAFDERQLDYGQAYDNTQTHSGTFDAYVDDLVRSLVERHGIRNCTVVEVGCGKGHFLRKLVAYPGADIRGIGFDTSYAGPVTEFDGRLTFHRSYYDENAGVKADAVVCRHVIEHIAKPREFLDGVATALKHTPQARVFFETPCVEWIFRNAVLWDLFYEHCSLFSAASLRFAFERAGFQVDEVAHVFGGQYLWLAGRAGSSAVSAPGGDAVAQLARGYAKACAEIQAAWTSRISDLKKHGGVALWGAGAEGVTFANLLDPHQTALDCVVDINPNKQGRFIPGTGHPIVAPQALTKRGVRSTILVNPNYRAEVSALLTSLGAAVDLVGQPAL